MIDRRGFLGAIPLAAWATSMCTPAPDSTRDRTPDGTSDGTADGTPDRATDDSRGSSRDRLLTLERLGVQLYTLRQEMADDPDRTLAAVAGFGYKEVELAGLYGMSSRDMRSKLDAVGLRAASSHHGIDVVRDDWTRTLEEAQELGQSLIVVPSLPEGERTPTGLARIADDFNRAGEAARAAGLRFGYHNHDWELRPLADGSLPMDLLLDLTDEEYVDWQMDVFWTVHGTENPNSPFTYLENRAGRVTSLHLKDRTAAGEMVDVGDGVIDYLRFIPQAEARGIVLHAFVEHDFPGDALTSIRRSYRHLTGGV